MAHLLVVDDEPSICWGLARLGKQLGHTVAVATSAEEAFKLAGQQRPDAIVLDVRLPGMDGLSAMQHFHDLLGRVPIIVVTAYGALSTAVTAVRNGAFDYLTKPFDLDAAQLAIQRALESPQHLAEAPPVPVSDLSERIIGTSAVMQEVFKRIALVAPSDACVHLRGESGTGKELAARAIHRYSRRSAGPFVAVNVASLSPTLAESELFGHVRGAFTGAEQSRKGLLEQAHGGTIFLDEVADIPLAIQVKLLRVLEYGEVLPVGADRPVMVDFRVISATHQDLRRRVAAGKFRHDLYFRLITFEIEIPPLRERRDDIRALAERFLDLLAAKSASTRPSLSPAATHDLENRHWYGNVRELRNALEHAVILAHGGQILPEHLPPPVSSSITAYAIEEDELDSLIQRWTEFHLQQSPDATDIYSHFLKVVELPLLRAAMEHHHGQCAAAARQLGIHRTTLRKRLDQLGLGDSCFPER